ncbi:MULTISPECIES: hypothetical protein [unclassified Mesorhizobium]|nr:MULTISPECIES: hypothetical protein [unclassified Mesorhizobium]
MAAERNDDPDAALDRLVLEAALAEGDDQALARKVLARIEAGSSRPSFLPRLLLSRAGFAACAAAALIAATLAGYQAARLQDDPSDMELLALASGSSLAYGVSRMIRQRRARFEAFPDMDGDAGGARPFARGQLLPARLCLARPAQGRGARVLLSEIASTYPPEVRKEFRGVLRDNGARTFQALRELRAAGTIVAAAQTAKPFDEAAVKDATAGCAPPRPAFRRRCRAIS